MADAAGGGIVVDGNRIIELVATGRVPRQKPDEVFDASEHVVLPGLINSHHHFFQTLTRAHPGAINKELFPWLEALYPVWAKMTPEDMNLAVYLAMVEMMLSGVTCTADHHYLFPSGLENAMDIEVNAARQLGMRLTVTRGSMNLSQKDGGLPPDSVVEDSDAILADCERLAANCHDPSDGALIQVALAPCSPFSVTGDLMRGCADIATRYGCRLHTHLAETADEDAYCREHFSMRPLDYLESTGWLTDRTWLAHGIHFDDSEIARLGAAGVGICHCPTSNMVLGSGQCRTKDLEAAGSPVGLGVDGSASNDSSNMMEEIRHALLLNRLTYGAAHVTHLDVLGWATHGSARCLGRLDTGRIGVGKQADLALFRLDEMRFSGAGDALAALVLCGASRADRVMIAGEWKVINRHPVDIDLDRLRHLHTMAARRYAGQT